MNSNREHLPLVYSCSGCSNLAQMANDIAIMLDRKDLAEMSCIAGVGGNVTALVKKAKSGRQIISLDGCQLHCVNSCLARHGIKPDLHYTFTDFGLKKQYQVDCDTAERETLAQQIINDLNPDFS